MNESELLELAAKAAGYKVYSSGKLFRIWKDSNVEWVDWNPLSDDGDAWRLAVDLLFEIDMDHGGVAVRHATGIKVLEVFNHDPHSATRLAIVRAAAEIGKIMEK